MPQVVQTVEPSVVTIISKVGLGSGVIYKADGTIVTDAHVVEGQDKQPFRTVEVQFADGKRARASVVGVDDVTDVAVIKAKRTGLPAARFNDTLPVVGALDVVIGSPLGLEQTVTAGIISSLHRNMPPSKEAPQGLIDLIQTDAPISPGNSGGAVADGDGTVIGLSEAYLPPSSGAVAIGFVTPAATVTSVADQLLATGNVKHAFLGIQPADITPQTADQFNLPTTKGTLVVAVTRGSPAQKAGLQPGDVITRLGATTIDTVTDLLAALRKQQPGSTVPLTYARGSRTSTVKVTLANRPAP
ncbi:S1C family serine protease [Segeticoccus rhizosphaerae]|uniref:S1C family serine protease n=1 Tax=Segeticoccus rhizosphaerae TaxID=1104777 RepID=UPI001EEF7B88|nr:trypsin-like peptidase domain-containing protein [Segeticoccus rhizosphaerae]